MLISMQRVRQEGVGGELGELAAPQVGAQDALLCHPAAIHARQGLDRGGVLAADQHPIGVGEVLDGRALGQKLRTLPPSGRAFNAALFETPAKLAHLRQILAARGLPTAALDDGWRAWMQTGLETPACQESRQTGLETPACQESRDAGPQQQAVHDAFHLFNKTLAAPLSSDLLKPSGEAIAANLEPFADNDATRQQAQHKAVEIRRQGFFGVAMASQTEIAYTGLIDTLNKLDSNFKIR